MAAGRRTIETATETRAVEAREETGLAALEARYRRDARLTAFPEPEWVPPRTDPGGERVLDVLIIGAGQGGIAVAHQLLRERVTNILLVDRAPAGREGIWRSFARMKTLRTPKTVTGPDLGMPSLTFEAWYEARHGAAAFEALNKIAKEDWQDYLFWLRRTLDLPVRNGVTLEGLRPEGGLIAARLADASGTRELLARKVVLAMGIETSGRWWMPPEIEALPTGLRAHSADSIDFANLAGRDVAVIGAGASAFDNAASALEAGARRVTLLCRRPALQRVQPYKAVSNPGFLRHLGDLDDASRFEVMRYMLDLREALPRETWDRVTIHHAFALLTGAPIEAAQAVSGRARLITPQGPLEADFVIAATGFAMDLDGRPELASFAQKIARWGDLYPPAADHPRLAAYPYLASDLSFIARNGEPDPFLSSLYCFNFGSTMSFGPSGSSINGMKFAVPRLVAGITRSLLHEDRAHHIRALKAYDAPEFPLTFARERNG